MATQKKPGAKKQGQRGGRGARPERLPPKAQAAARRAADSLWGQGVTPHRLLQEVHELLLLRCLKEAEGNYAAAAERFGPSRQSVQQYANSPLRDGRWKAYQQNRRKNQDGE
jgi:hypothetical protein